MDPGTEVARPRRRLGVIVITLGVLAVASGVDSQARMGRALGVEPIPATFIVSPDGMIRWQGDPFLDHNHERNRQLWDELITDLAAKYLDEPRS